jgi:hypothetical protein
MKFATNQPAPSGNIVVHCGGPGSTSKCIGFLGNETEFGKENAANYNIISIDQVRKKGMLLHMCVHHKHGYMYCYLYTIT